MPPSEPLSVEVVHRGRGGEIRVVADGRAVRLPIELQPGGGFSVWFPSDVTGPRRNVLRARLRAWLDAHDDARWVIEN